MKYVVAVVAVVLGAAGVIYGASDDSPGLQLIGVLLIMGAIAASILSARRDRNQTT